MNMTGSLDSIYHTKHLFTIFSDIQTASIDWTLLHEHGVNLKNVVTNKKTKVVNTPKNEPLYWTEKATEIHNSVNSVLLYFQH